MCLAIPGKVLALEAGPSPTARVDFEGQRKTVSLLYVPEAAVGDYVVVQAGFAIRVVPDAEAQEALALARTTTVTGASLRTATTEPGTASPESI